MKDPNMVVIEPTPEEKKKLLEGWVLIVQQECDDIESERSNKFEIYKALKSKYDGWLSKKLRWINKLEKRLNARKKQLEEIKEELKILSSSTDNP